MHTLDSDGHGTHDELADAAFGAGLDFIVVTDHNRYRSGLDGYRYSGGRRLLMLVGQELHDPRRQPERSHLLAYEAGIDLTAHVESPQALIDEVAARDGLSFLAHPIDCAAERFNEPGLPWDDWDTSGYTGIELWNFMSDFKCRLRTYPTAIFYALRPDRVPLGPRSELLDRWDGLLAAGRRVVAIGGSDAHALPVKFGPLNRVIFPYRWLFGAINTHVLVLEPLVGDLERDRRAIFGAIGRGNCYVSYDLPADPRGFSFSASSARSHALMGDQLAAAGSVTLQVACPVAATIRLIADGRPIREWRGTQRAVLTVKEPAAYRVELYLNGGRPWIFSNPIYVTHR